MTPKTLIPAKHLMALLVLGYGLLAIHYGEIVPVNQGLGWDGTRYAMMAADFAAVLHGKWEAYYVQRMAPSAVVHVALAAFGLQVKDAAHPTPGDIQHIVRAFQWYNLAMLMLGSYLWNAVARRLRLSLRGCWLGFFALFANTLVLKAFYEPASMDPTTYLAALGVFYCYLARRPIALLMVAIAGTFACPLLLYFAFLLLLFPRRTDEPPPSFRFLPPAVYALPAAAVALLTWYFYVFPTYPGYFIDRSEPIWQLTAPLAALIVAVFIILAVRPLLDRDFFYQLARGYRQTTLRGVLYAVALFLTVRLVLACIPVAPPEFPAGRGVRWYLEMVCLGSIQKPGLFLLAHISYFGPIIILALFFWPRICAAIRQCGLGLVLAVGMGVFWAIRPETRQILTFLPILVALATKAFDESRRPTWLYVLFISLALLASRFWLPINCWGPLRAEDDYSGFPWQLVFMTAGPWMSGLSFTLVAIFSLAIAALVWLMYVDAPRATLQRFFHRARRPGLQLAAVNVGIVVGQSLLYGPSLLGSRIMLPLDYLALPGVYLPRTPAVEKIVPHNYVFSDLALSYEPGRQFVVSEIRQGRLPQWDPKQYLGAPFIYLSYSPLSILNNFVASPLALPWTQLLQAVFAGLGMYLFCRRVLRVGHWPATIVAWLYPLTGSFILWQIYTNATVTAWLPWILWAVDSALRRPLGWGGPVLAAVTFLVIVSAHVDIAGQVLLASGLYALWCCIDHYRRRWNWRHVLTSLAAVSSAWGLGFLLAAFMLLPMVSYLQTGSRFARRGLGEEERPPVGLAALPQTVLPDMYGSTQHGSFPMFPPGQGNQLESSVQTYCGLLATLLAAPLAWCSRRHRSINVYWLLLALVGLAWSLNVPGLVPLLRMPGLNMMSHNRFVFVTSFALLAMTAEGLNVLRRRAPPRRWWFWLPAALLGIIFVYCGLRALILPEPLATQLAHAVQAGQTMLDIRSSDGVQRAQHTYSLHMAVAAALAALGVAGWLLLIVGWRKAKAPASSQKNPLRVAARSSARPGPTGHDPKATRMPVWYLPALASVLVADLLWFAGGRAAQCDPALYYPRIGTLQQLAKAPPGRIVGHKCLPATLAETHGLYDLRGYDGVDPARLVDLLYLVDPDLFRNNPPYAATQWFTPPKIQGIPPGRVRLPPILDMLGVRYVVFRGDPPPNFSPQFSSADYWAAVNDNSLPRVSVPPRIETLTNDGVLLGKIADPGFNSRTVAYVSAPVEFSAPCRGRAAIIPQFETATQVTVQYEMDTPGLIVLADLYDGGWKAFRSDIRAEGIPRANPGDHGNLVLPGNAYLAAEPVPILRTNYALRGVAVPAGRGLLQFRYEPDSLRWGLRLHTLGLAILSLWGAGIIWRRAYPKNFRSREDFGSF